MGDNKLLNSEFTVQWLSDILLNSFKSKLSNCDVIKLIECTESGNKIAVGHTANICAVDLVWSPKNDALPHAVVLKIPGTRDGRPIAQHIRDVHNAEASFYETFANLPQLKVPHCYYARSLGMTAAECDQDKDAVIVMDNVPNGLHPDVVKGFTLAQVKSYIDTTVTLAAECIADRAWPSRLQHKHTADTILPLSQAIINYAVGIRKLQPGRFDAYFDKLAAYVTPEALADTMLNTHTKLGKPPVLAHGDVWTNNLIYSKDDPSNLLAIVDWQVCHAGVPVEDFAHMLARGFNFAERRRVAPELIEYYHSKLTATLDARKVDNPYSLADLGRAFNLVQPFAMLGYFMAVTCIVQWNKANMTAEDVEGLYTNCDEYLKDVSALCDKGLLV